MRVTPKVAVGIAVVIVVAVVAVFALRGLLAPEPGPPPITGPERAEDARALLAQYERSGRADHDEAYEHARRFQRDGQLADAQLLLFFSARANHGPSAFALATMNDPNHHSADTSLLPEPDAYQAYRWYAVAREQGIDDAPERLAALRGWAVDAAAAGDAEAERFLLSIDE